ncbi:MAG: response regulator [Desulfobulbaceae bacterium]|nr:response regulator [Desulfobulbaceae bacterium]
MKKTDATLRQQTLLLQTIIESLPHPFYVVDVKDYSIVLANAALGPVDSWQGKTCHQVTHHRDFPCSGEEDICPMAHVLRTGEPVTVEHIHYNAQGEQRLVEVSGYPVFDDSGEIAQMIEYSKDITEVKKAEEERVQLEDKLRQAQKMEAIGTLAGGIAHDFNNILTAIIGYGEMVKDTIPEGAEARQDIDQVLKAGQRAKDLVQHILTFSRQSQKEYGPIQVHLVVKEALKLLRATIPTTIEIRENIDPRCGSIISEPTAIHQIVMNLCTNACHVMENTGGTMEVTLAPVTLSREETMNHPDVETGPYIRLSVRDTGTGIDPSTLGRIFEPYFTTKKQGEGTGMGLAVLHGIVTGHRGMINVESTLGKGAVFHVYLPRADTDSAYELTREEVVPGGEESILLVDDETAVAEMEHRMLKRLGYRVTSRVSSIEALHAFRENPARFDLVITDQTMPQMTGAELAIQILKIRPDIPIILCTGYSKHINENNAKALGIRAFIMKPLLKSEIAGLIRNVLDTGHENRK